MNYAQRLALAYIRVKFRLLTMISPRNAAEKAFSLFCTPQSRSRDKLPPIFEEATKLDFEFESYRIRGYQWNDSSQRKALIIHGFESSVINFDRYIRPLIRLGYQVLALDAPAHGRTSGRQINALVYKRFILEINRRFGPIHSFMAHSFGGLALALALEEIEHDENTRVVMIAPATETSTAVDSFFKFTGMPAILRDHFEDLIFEIGGKPVSWYSISRAASNIRALVLWFHDKDDDTTPLKDVMAVKAQALPNFEFVITEGLGHRRIYRDNIVSKQIVTFLGAPVPASK